MGRRHGIGKRETEADAHGFGFIEMQRIRGGHPRAGLVQHEHARMRNLVGVRHGAASGHVRLADEEEEIKFFFRW